MQTLSFDIRDLPCKGCTGSVQREPAHATPGQIGSAIVSLGYAASVRPAAAYEKVMS